MKNELTAGIPVWLATFAFALSLHAAEPALPVKVVVGHNDEDQASASFKFKNVPSPSASDAASKLTFAVLSGQVDAASGGGSKLTDGKLPTDEDEPRENFFFDLGTDGGRLTADLGKVIRIKQINTYSWHPGSRGPQVYNLYASDGSNAQFLVSPLKGIDPAQHGWTLIAKVNTRSEFGSIGGQYGVSIGATNGPIGQFRHLLFDCFPTDEEDRFGNTFYSEIDVVDADAAEVTPIERDIEVVKTFDTEGGKYHITINASSAPDLADWAFQELAPVLQSWYPKLIELLPSEGFLPPAKMTIKFQERLQEGVPAFASGSRITLNGAWFRDNLKGEAIGAVVHETVHVLQRYDRPRRESHGTPFPGWLVEGIPDYIRFFKFEPQNHGADDGWLKRQKFSGVRYDKSYRISANFLDWVSEKYDPEIVVKLNAAGRLGNFTEDLWKTATQKTVEQLGAEWLETKQQQFGIAPSAAVKMPRNTPGTPAQKL